MASYNQALKEAFLVELDNVFGGVDVYTRESIKAVALNAMETMDNDVDVANAVMDYVRKNHCDNGNVIFAHCLGFVPKTLLYNVRHENIRFLGETRDEPPYPLFMTTSCGNSVQMPAVSALNEPVTIVCILHGGEDPEDRGVEYSLKVSPAGSSSVVQVTERQFEVTFTKPVVYTLTGTSKETDRVHAEAHCSATVAVRPSVDNPPTALSIVTSCGDSVEMPFVDSPNEPVSITCTLNGGEDPEGEGVEYSLSVVPEQYSSIEKISERQFKVVFTEPGEYTITGTAQEINWLRQSVEATMKVTALPSTNNPPSPLVLTTSCGDSVEMPYVNKPDEPVTITCTLSGGEDPEGKAVEYSLEVSPKTSVSIKTVNDKKFEITFSKSGTYTLTGIAKEAQWLQQTVKAVKSLTVKPSTNNPPSEPQVTLSCGSSLQLGTSNTAETITATIGGAVDPEGKKVTISVECSTADKVAKVNDTKWNITLSATGIHVIIATATDETGLKSVKTAMVQVEGSSQSSGSSTGQFAGEKFDSGWSDLISGCYVSALNFSISISSGHSSSNDTLVLLGKKSNGTVVILHDKFNAANRFKVVDAGTEVTSTLYTKGNLSSTTHAWTNDPYTLEDDIRQVRYICQTPGHASCASNAVISYEMKYTYDSSLS